MARPRKFDEKSVLDAASDVFWTKGYEATSTRDLSACTGLTPSSMYAAFGDKRGLFRSALDHYLGRLRNKMSYLERSFPPGLAIAGFFADSIEKSLSDPLQRGCMLVNSTLESSPRDAEFRDAIAHELKLIEEFFHRCFLAAKEGGEIPCVHASEQAAQQLLVVLLGIRVLARACPDYALMAGAVEQTLGALSLPSLSDVPASS